MFNRADAIDAAFTQRLTKGDLPDVGETSLRSDHIIDLLDTALMNRHLDLAARRSKGKTFYSIGSSGHDDTICLGLAFALLAVGHCHGIGSA